MATVAIGTIGNIQGSVEVVHADGSKELLQQGATVYADDAITTGENATVRIEFLDGSSMLIGPEFTAVLDEEVFDPALLGEEAGTTQMALDATDREITPSSGHDTEGKGEKVATIEVTVGVVEAIDEDGNVRVLQAGDALYANDILSVGEDGDVSITLVDGSLLSFGPGEAARMVDVGSTSVAEVTPAAVIVDPAQIASIIQEGRDPTQEAAAPAAGPESVTGNEGGEFTVITPSSRQVTPGSGHETHGFELPFNLPEQELFLEEPVVPVSGVVTASATGPDSLVNEAGLTPFGSNAGSGTDSVTGTFTINATDGIKELVVDSEGPGAGGAPITFTLAQVKAFAVTNGTVDTGEGTLTLVGYTGTDFAGTVNYSYTLKDTIDNDSKLPVGTDAVTLAHFDDTALLTVNGISGSTGSDQLVIRAIDDQPQAVNDGPAIVTEDVAPNVISGNVLPNDISGADIPKAFVSWATTGPSATSIIELAKYGTLVQNPDGSWEYTLNNADADTQALTAADNLLFDLFYTMTDADGDQDTAKLTINVKGANDTTTVVTANAITPDNTVFEDGLNPNGSMAGTTRETDTGVFTINATDGIKELVIDSEGLGAGGAPITFTLAQVKAFAVTNGTVDMGEGILTLTGYTGNPLLGGADFAGTVNYSYTLKDTIDNDSKLPVGTDAVTLAHFDDTALLTVNGVGGSTGSDQLVIRAIDDQPQAVNDGPAIVTEDVAPNVISGNVLPNDISGADIPKAFVSWATTGPSATSIIELAKYGTLVQNPDGSWEYTLNNADADTQALTAADNLLFDLFYTMTDADGDQDTAKLTINVKGANDTTTVVTANAITPDNTVFEDGLNPNGSMAGTTRETDTGVFTINATDGIKELVIDSEGLGAGGAPITFTLAQVKAFAVTNGTVDMGEGILTLTGYTGNPLLGGADFAGTVNYSYTLKDTIDNDSKLPVGTDAVTLAHFDDTALLTVNGVGGSTGSDQLVIRAIDDQPQAVNDGPAIVTEDVAPNVISGNVLPNDISGADIPKAFVSWATTGPSATSIIELAKYGTLVQNPDGSWEYTLNNADADTQALTAADNLLFDLFYTMTDADGDQDTAKLTINVKGANDTTTVVTANAITPDNTVFEDGLNPNGSMAGTTRETDTGVFTINATDGIKELVIDSEGLGAGGAPITFTLAQVKAFAVTNGTVDMGEGILTLTGYTGNPLLGGADFAGTVNYSYTLKDTIDNDSKLPVGTDAVTLAHFDDTALLTVNGVGGSTGSDQLVIRAIDDQPQAVNDGPAIVTEDVAPNVISGNVLPNDISGADIPKAFVSWATTGPSATSIIELAKYGTLVQNPDGSWEYTLNNADADTQALTAADNLLFDLFYTMTDADGDQDTAKLTINVKGANDTTTVVTANAITPDNTVFEDGLNPNGSMAGTTRETDTGVFTINATDGIKELVIDSEGLGAGGAPITFTLAQVKAFAVTNGTVDMGEGILTLTGYTGNPLLGGADFAGTVNYSYTLKDTIDNDSKLPVGTDAVTLAHFDDTALLTVNGISGSTGSDQLVIRAIDDQPQAVNDGPAIVTEDVAPNVISGNVLPNDISGADIPKAFVSWATTGPSATSIIELAKYGTLVQNPDGSWEYTLNNADADTQALTAADNLLFDLFYTMTDADGDQDTAKLTINVKGANDTTTVVTANAITPDNTVFEDGLNPNGSMAGTTRETDTGVFTINATDGIKELVIDSEGLGAGGAPITFTLAQVKAFAVTNGTVDMGEGILTLTGYTGNPLLGGADFAGTVNYSYTLKDTIDNDSKLPVGTDAVTLAHFDDTALLTVNGVGGSTGSDQLVIRAIDDQPQAFADRDKVLVSQTTDGNVLTGVDANDPDGSPDPTETDVSGADVAATVTGVAVGDTGTTAVGNINTGIVGTLGGTLTLQATGGYVYEAPTNVLGADVFTYTITDADGDTSTTTLSIDVGGLIIGSNNDDDVPDPTEPHVVPRGPTDPSGTIQGADGDDVLVGDPGGSAGIDANVVLVLDASLSMLTAINFGAGTISRQDAQKNAVNAMLDKLEASDAANVRVHLVEFSTSAKSLGTFNIIENGVVNTAQLAAARTAVGTLGPTSIDDQNTNYEAGLQQALHYLNSTVADPNDTITEKPLDASGPNDVNQLVFVSDGLPNRALLNDSTDVAAVIRPSSPNEALAHLTGSYDDTSPANNDDTVNEIDAIESRGFTIEAVGINVNAAGVAILDQVEGAGGAADNITTAEQLSDVLDDLTPIASDIGADIINGGDGDDIIFGDVLNTDQLASDQFGAAGSHNGQGYAALVAHLEDDGVGGGLGVGNVDNIDVMDFIKANLMDLAADGRGKDDTLNGGAGNDIIIGQGGDDNMTGGAGNDTYLWVAGDKGSDTITDFKDSDVTGGTEEDVLNIADLLVGEELLDHSSLANLAADLDVDYISITRGASTTITIYSDGGGAGTPTDDQVVNLTGFNTIGMSSADVIESLLNGGNLVTD